MRPEKCSSDVDFSPLTPTVDIYRHAKLIPLILGRGKEKNFVTQIGTGTLNWINSTQSDKPVFVLIYVFTERFPRRKVTWLGTA